MERTIEVSTTLRASVRRIEQVLLLDPGCPLGPQGASDQLRMTLSAGRNAAPGIHHEVTVELGPLHRRGDVLSVPISWEPTGWHRLFPNFVGDLQVSPHGDGSSLRLHGTYDVPLGPLGRFGDGIAGRRLARQSLSTFLEQAAWRIDAAADRRTDAQPPVPNRYPVAVREPAVPELYLG